jgi:hypothetical protein
VRQPKRLKPLTPRFSRSCTRHSTAPALAPFDRLEGWASCDAMVRRCAGSASAAWRQAPLFPVLTVDAAAFSTAGSQEEGGTASGGCPQGAVARSAASPPAMAPAAARLLVHTVPHTRAGGGPEEGDQPSFREAAEELRCGSKRDATACSGAAAIPRCARRRALALCFAAIAAEYGCRVLSG